MAGDQKRYQVFISSTFMDLREERQAVTAALLECDALPSGMELFPAADDDAWTLITKVIDECDYYLLVLGGKYGSVDSESNLSYTEKEFDYAVSQQKPVMAFLHGDIDSLKRGKIELDEPKRKSLEKFREKVQTKKHVKYWTSPDQLAGQVALTYNKFIRLYEAVGWVRADKVANAETLTELAAARAELERLKELLRFESGEHKLSTADLSQGEDPLRVTVSVDAQYTGANGLRSRSRNWAYYSTTWNDVLKVIGPRMFDESSEADIINALEQWLWDYHAELLEKLFLLGFNDPKSVHHKSDVVIDEISIDAEQLATIVTQFKALGYIEKSIRKRSVLDAQTYWSLTAKGEREVVNLLAARKNDPPLDPPR